MAKVIVVTSGKGGVGKTTSSAAIGTAIALRGYKTAIIDFDVGLRNLDLIMGCERRVVYDLINVIHGEATLNQALIKDKRVDSLYILPASQTRDKDALTQKGVEKVLKDLAGEHKFDFIVCDSPAGIEKGAMLAMYFADEAIVVTNPEVSSVRDSDRILGILSSKTRKAEKNEGKIKEHLLLTRYSPERVANGEMLSVDDVKEILAIPLLGVIPESKAVLKASNSGVPVSLDKESDAGQAYLDAVGRFLALVIFFATQPHHVMSPGSFVAMLTAMLAAFKPVRDLSQVNSSIQRGLAAAEGIFELLDQPAEEDTGSKTLTQVKGELQINHVNFHYQAESSVVLKDIHLSIPAGKTVAFVGKSGSGKTTLVSLLARFYEPTEGEILLDGVNIKELKLKNLRQQFAMVSQHVSLFDDTVYHNIAFGDQEGASEAAVIEALKMAHAWEFVEHLPLGLQTMIGENGFNLSGGQRQRLAIARAILKNAPILILDEATSALDNESERAIQEALEELRAHRTIVVIAHRLSTIEKADIIVVLDKGAIVETGSHQDLLDQKGIYAQLYKLAEF